MENVFIASGAQIKSEFQQKVFDKPNRSAFVFITAEPDSTFVALEDLRKIDEVTEVYLAKGAYDLVAKIKGESLDFLSESVLKRIKNLSGIKSILTLTLV